MSQPDLGPHSKKNIPLPHYSHSGGEDHGEGNWLVSYADMMTLLVGFFIILMSFSTVDQEKLEELKKAITKQFGGTYQIPFNELKDRIKDPLNKLGLGDQFVITQNSQGVEISFLGTVFFDTGSADLKSAAKELLSKLIPIVKNEASNFKIVIEGHTDDVPISGVLFHNNWELSSIRACRVLDEFAQSGLLKTNLTALGFGETKPIVPNRDIQGNPIPENQSQNRRVVIKILKPTESVIKE